MKAGRKIILIAGLVLLGGVAWTICNRHTTASTPLDDYSAVREKLENAYVASFVVADASLEEAVGALNGQLDSQPGDLPRFGIWKEGDPLPKGMHRKLPGGAPSLAAARDASTPAEIAVRPTMTLALEKQDAMLIARYIAAVFKQRYAASGNSLVFYPDDFLEYDTIERQFYLLDRLQAQFYLDIPKDADGGRIDMHQRLVSWGLTLSPSDVAYYEPRSNKVVLRCAPDQADLASALFVGGCTSPLAASSPMERVEMRFGDWWYANVTQRLRPPPAFFPAGGTPTAPVAGEVPGIPGLDSDIPGLPPPAPSLDTRGQP
jgi:hypothetical protein